MYAQFGIDRKTWLGMSPFAFAYRQVRTLEYTSSADYAKVKSIVQILVSIEKSTTKSDLAPTFDPDHLTSCSIVPSTVEQKD